ncbi:MAG: sugar phosphate isomerase/epimerase family protein [Infirmifilum sp.]
MFKYSLVVAPEHAQFEAVARGEAKNVINLLSQLGYDGVEFSLIEPSALPELARLAAEHGLKVPAVGTGLNYIHLGLDLTHPDEGVRKAALEKLMSFVDKAHKANVDGVIVGLIRGRGDAYRSREQPLKLLSESISVLCKHAEDLGVRILFEPLNRYETRLINNVEEALEFISRIDCPNLYLLLDTFHMNIEEPIIEDSIRLAGGKIGHFHVADSNRYAPGMGHLDFSSILSALRDTDYEGFVSAEIIVKPDLETAARLTLNVLRIASQPP